MPPLRMYVSQTRSTINAWLAENRDGAALKSLLQLTVRPTARRRRRAASRLSPVTSGTATSGPLPGHAFSVCA